MAGQTPEPTFQPGGQDSGLTQGRPWQMPSDYTPPGGASAGAGGGSGAGQAYPQQPPSAPSDFPPSGVPRPSDYGAQQEQGYGAPNPNAGYGQYQQGYQGYGQGAPTPPPQWQQAPGQGAPGQATHGGRPQKPPKQPGEHGLIGSLFDFSFSSMVTPKIIRALYTLITVWTILVAVGILVFFASTGGLTGALLAIIIVDPIFILLSLGIYRVVLEAFMVIFQIHGELKTIRAQGEK